METRAGGGCRERRWARGPRPYRHNAEMKFNPDIHHRRSLRLKNFDYATPRAYFITVCTKNRECLLGDIVDGEMKISETGRIDRIYSQAELDYLDQLGIEPVYYSILLSE